MQLNYVKAIEDRQGLKIACIEEIAYKMGYIDKKQALILADRYEKSGYGAYIRRVVEEDSALRTQKYSFIGLTPKECNLADIKL